MELYPGKEVWVNYGDDGKATLATSAITAYDEGEDEFRTKTGGRYRARSLRSEKDDPVPTEPGWRREWLVREEGGGYRTMDDDGGLHSPWWTVVVNLKETLPGEEEGGGNRKGPKRHGEEGGEEGREKRRRV